ncbi:hypothetical protein BKA67DRAFT_529311 [Truncatella angustata]|uniref:Uncharacterized protein n=1 Tax=Truncatella angustata TaxID=152316 RepID=A0A9P9A3D3_9PEZI|nr:uncharacterized protein BKA67DRAFT_529311 [Truncatella angustata]KAH6659135.1 hypothetical protein BKA67DRAFT_529311 [Truncatella angustata]
MTHLQHQSQDLQIRPSPQAAAVAYAVYFILVVLQVAVIMNTQRDKCKGDLSNEDVSCLGSLEYSILADKFSGFISSSISSAEYEALNPKMERAIGKKSIRSRVGFGDPGDLLKSHGED